MSQEAGLPIDPSGLGTKPLIQNDHSAVELRELRRRVKHTCSLISGNGPVHERPGENWAADMESRTVFWRPSNPFPPFDIVSDEDVTYLCTHEASHLNYSGMWDIPEKEFLSDEDKARFHRFVNAVEDIRCDRLSAEEFPGFPNIAKNVDAKYHGELSKAHPEDWNFVDQVGINLIWKDRGLPLLGKPDAQRIANEAWPEITRVANEDSTDRVAKAILPLYQRLRDDKENASGKGAVAPGFGADSPTGQPVRSGGAPGTGPLSKGESLQGMANDANGQGGQKLKEMAREDDYAESNAEQSANLMEGNSAGGTRPGTHPTALPREDVAAWERVAETMRGEINALTGRLRATLKTNAMDVWEGGKKSGQLHTRKAYRAAAGNPRIFRKRHALGALDYTFGVIIDRSGSMQGQKLDAAFRCTVLVAEALYRAQLPCFIIPWQTEPDHLKPAKADLKPHKGMLGGLLAHSGGGTYEAPALVMAQEQFAMVPSGHRMMFTITDGQTQSPEESKQLIGELRDHGVRCVAIGLGFRPADHYDITLELQDPLELAHLLPRFINETMRKGGGY